jgi:23S rRNA (uracil1939-C5)-methyltransferase
MVIEELPISVVHHGPGGELTLAGGHSLAIQVGGRAFRVSAGSFFQVNTRLAERMVLHILDRIDFRPGMQVADLYCGVGLFSAFLAPRVARLIGVESSPSACADFEENLDEFDNVELYEAPVEQALPAFDLKPSVVLVDPPRAGLSREARCGVLSLQPEQIVYVSCDPSTLSRDAKEIIRSGYHLASVTPFDMFPQTYHIESVSIFERFN